VFEKHNSNFTTKGNYRAIIVCLCVIGNVSFESRNPNSNPNPDLNSNANPNSKRERAYSCFLFCLYLSVCYFCQHLSVWSASPPRPVSPQTVFCSVSPHPNLSQPLPFCISQPSCLLSLFIIISLFARLFLLFHFSVLPLPPDKRSASTRPLKRYPL
jgi:hypothetical protein